MFQKSADEFGFEHALTIAREKYTETEAMAKAWACITSSDKALVDQYEESVIKLAATMLDGYIEAALIDSYDDCEPLSNHYDINDVDVKCLYMTLVDCCLFSQKVLEDLKLKDAINSFEIYPDSLGYYLFNLRNGHNADPLEIDSLSEDLEKLLTNLAKEIEAVELYVDRENNICQRKGEKYKPCEIKRRSWLETMAHISSSSYQC